MGFKKHLTIVGYFCILILVIGEHSCGLNNDTNLAAKAKIEHGGRLAHKYCSGCHQFPAPGLLDKATWQTGIMPVMAKKLGIDDFQGMFTSGGGAAISPSDFQLIYNFYLSLAPDQLKAAKKAVEPQHDMAIFKLRKVAEGNIKAPPLTTALAYNPYNGLLYSADAENNLFCWDKKLRAHFVKKLPSPATSILFNKGASGNLQIVIACIGSLMPANVISGKVIKYSLRGKSIISEQVLADSLPRTVKVLQGDFNHNGLECYAILCFGHENGGLYWLRELSSHKFEKKLIRGIPGAIDASITDIDNDSWPDILCLFAQADEGIWMFLNNHRGGFVEKNLLRFPPVYGSDSFQFADMNNDGEPDIVYTAGDNADYSPILKPYHGI